MSLFDRVRGWLGRRIEDAPDDAEQSEPQIAEDPAPSPAEPESPSSALAGVGKPGGLNVGEAIQILRRLRGTVHEADAVRSALTGLGRWPIPEPVLVACADILAARGDEDSALRVLAGTTSAEALMLAADLHAASGQLARAIGTIERVLARDLTAPGAKERHARWSGALGYRAAPQSRLDEATIVAPKVADGPFVLLREVARGGAGAVYEAEDRVLGRRVAFKVYHAKERDRPMIEREARTMAALAGPGVLRVFDAGPGEGWIALEWITRGSLRDVLRSGDISSLRPVARWSLPLARALARVHAAGVVHADVKPANVLLRAPDDPLLGDFGIARLLEDQREPATSGGGSAGYLSPERLSGKACEPRDDVYGYGRVLEDVLLRLGDGEPSAYRALALHCLSPERPDDGAALVRALQDL